MDLDLEEDITNLNINDDYGNKGEIKEKDEERAFQNLEESTKSFETNDGSENYNEGNTPRKLPTIIGPQFMHILAMITIYLDPTSFIRLILSCKKLYRWAEQGFLKVPIQLECKASKTIEDYDKSEETGPVLVFKGRTLNYYDFISLREAVWFQVEIGRLRVYADITQRFMNQLLRLLNDLNVKNIYEVSFIQSVDFELFSQFNIRKVECYPTDLDFLKSSSLCKVNHVKFDFECWINTEENRQAIADFIDNSTAAIIHFEYTNLRLEYIAKLINRWMSGAKEIGYIYFEIDWEQYSSDLLNKLNVQKILKDPDNKFENDPESEGSHSVSDDAESVEYEKEGSQTSQNMSDLEGKLDEYSETSMDDAGSENSVKAENTDDESDANSENEEENENSEESGGEDANVEENEAASISPEMQILRDTMTVKVRSDLRSVNADYIKNMIGDEIPTILLGVERSLVCINENSEMLLVHFDDICESESVTLKTL